MGITTSQTTFVDSAGLAPRTYYYRIASVDTSGALSRQFSFVAVTVQPEAPPSGPPEPLGGGGSGHQWPPALALDPAGPRRRRGRPDRPGRLTNPALGGERRGLGAVGHRGRPDRRIQRYWFEGGHGMRLRAASLRSGRQLRLAFAAGPGGHARGAAGHWLERFGGESG